ncbi:MAG: glycosyltransferase [Terriglobia bacterium]
MSGKIKATVSAIIPARNEETNIARSVRSVAAQQGILEVIVVDDQSQDRTAEILIELGAEIPQLRVIRVSSLPEGWTGKSYALTIAAAQAKGEWLLFTDADTEHLPGSLEQLLKRAQTTHTDLLSVSPGQRTPTWWEKAILPRVFLELSKVYRFQEVSDPKSSEAAANGQYILIRRSIYQEAGGHQAGRKTILEDVDLARRVKQSGGRLLFLPGGSWVQTRMYQRFEEMWAGWSKNLYLLFRQDLASLLRVVFHTAFLDVLLPLFLFGVPLFVGTSHGLLRFSVCWASGCVLLAVQYASYRRGLRRLGYPSSLARYLVLGSALFALLLLNSARIYRSAAGQVRWKGRVYAAKGSL